MLFIGLSIASAGTLYTLVNSLMPLPFLLNKDDRVLKSHEITLSSEGEDRLDILHPSINRRINYIQELKG